MFVTDSLCHYYIVTNIFFSEPVLCSVLSDITGGILKPTLAGSNQPSNQQPEKLVSDDLDSSLANLVGSECDALLLAALIKARVH